MCCRQFVAHFMKSPEQLGAAETKAFILHLLRERRASPSSVGVYVGGGPLPVSGRFSGIHRAVEDLPRPEGAHAATGGAEPRGRQAAVEGGSITEVPHDLDDHLWRGT